MKPGDWIIQSSGAGFTRVGRVVALCPVCPGWVRVNWGWKMESVVDGSQLSLADKKQIPREKDNYL